MTYGQHYFLVGKPASQRLRHIKGPDPVYSHLPELSFLCCCWFGSMGLVFSVTVVIPEGGESGVFGRIGVGCPVGVPCGDVFVWICALIVAPVADCM